MPEVTDVHEKDCHCEQFSDFYKDINGVRPRGKEWTCREIIRWHDENYVEVRPNYFEPRK